MSFTWKNRFCDLLEQSVNPLHANINVHILHTLFYTIPLALTRRIFYEQWELLSLAIISFILMILMNDSESEILVVRRR